MGDDEKTFDAVGRRHFSVRRAADVEEFLSGGSIRPSAARRIRLTEKSFGRSTSYASGAREVKAEAIQAVTGLLGANPLQIDGERRFGRRLQVGLQLQF